MKPPINYKILDDIDNPDKAYFLGFFCADGYHLPKRNRLSICLNEKDRCLLESFNQMFFDEKNSHVYDHETKEHFIKGKYCPSTKSSSFIFQNKHISEKLSEMGIRNNKTNCLELPDIDNLYFYDFVRGYFDGDGTICCWMNKKVIKRWVIKICGCSSFLESIEKILNKDKIKTKIYNQGKIDVLYIHSPLSIKLFGEKIYSKPTRLFLSRKQEKFDEFLTNLKEKWGDTPPYKGRPPKRHLS